MATTNTVRMYCPVPTSNNQTINNISGKTNGYRPTGGGTFNSLASGMNANINYTSVEIEVNAAFTTLYVHNIAADGTTYETTICSGGTTVSFGMYANGTLQLGGSAPAV